FKEKPKHPPSRAQSLSYALASTDASYLSSIIRLFKNLNFVLLVITYEGNGNPLQYSCLENSMERGAWWATVHGVAKSQTGQVISRSLFLQTRNSLRVGIYVFLPV
ncbi:hypothetical protein FD755_013751, partial [Muntiacus reevesi]